jgi:F0F1-type ATP synthase membrane subunit b/b'
MSGTDDTGRSERVPPDGRAWRDAQRRIAERNDKAQKRGREQRAAHERQQQALRRAQEKRGGVYR